MGRPERFEHTMWKTVILLSEVETNVNVFKFFEFYIHSIEIKGVMRVEIWRHDTFQLKKKIPYIFITVYSQRNLNESKSKLI